MRTQPVVRRMLVSEQVPQDNADSTPDEVADRLEKLAHGWRASQEGALTRMEAALPGLVGEAAEALKDLIAHLQEKDAQTHAGLMRTAQHVRNTEQP